MYENLDTREHSLFGGIEASTTGSILQDDVSFLTNVYN